jgi:hypothetical protein
MYYTFELLREEVVEGQPQKHFNVLVFEDEAKTILVGTNTYVAGGAAYNDPEAEFLRAANAPPPEKHVWNYQDDRRNAYPSYADQFDLLYHGGYDAWKTAIDAVKTQYPKA